jgi:tyrosyl-tRNA synthetase
MVGKIMSIPDAILWDWFFLTTELPAAEINALRAACDKGQMNPRDAKMRLAKEIISFFHSSADAVAAEEHFNKVFKNKEVPDDVAEVKMEAGEQLLIDILVAAKLVASKSEARRVIGEGGVKVAGQALKDVDAKVSVGSKPVLIQKGKRHFVNIVAK